MSTVPARARLVVVSGPSGVGKGTLVSELLRQCPEVWLSVSATTRAPREHERPGKEYEFVSRDEFDAMIASDQLLEWAEFAGNRYGTPRQPVEARLAAGTPVVLEIELEGARQVRQSMPDALLVFVAPPSVDELRRRLVGRGTESDDAVARRLEIADHELAAQSEFDEIIVNDDVQIATERLISLVVA